MLIPLILASQGVPEHDWVCPSILKVFVCLQVPLNCILSSFKCLLSSLTSCLLVLLLIQISTANTAETACVCAEALALAGFLNNLMLISHTLCFINGVGI